MKEIVPDPPPIIRNDAAAVQGLFEKYVVPSYGRFDLVLSHGAGSYVYDLTGRRYLDLGAGIAVCSLGHSNADITQALIDQSRKLVHVSNLYYTEPQGRLAQAFSKLIGQGKTFFANSGAEANEGLYKVARKFGHDEGRFEVITTFNSFHGRTLAGISATGQEKVKKGFEPLVQGFRHVPYNDLEAMRAAISPATAAILIEGIQGEGGITPATAEYLLGLRALCDEKKLLLFMDEVQCGYFRTGRFASYQRLLENVKGAEGFIPDGISMAKSMGGGFPIAAFWLREPYGNLLGPGTHATTYGGTPLGCAVALKVLEVIERDRLADNARKVGEFIKEGLSGLCQKFPTVFKSARGCGFMIGLELAADIPTLNKSDKAPSIQFVNKLHAAGLLTVPSGTHIVRLLPPLTLRQSEAQEGLDIIEATAAALLS
jgi:acetylornithine/N-succinyldiaminopimelate aminotransferase